MISHFVPENDILIVHREDAVKKYMAPNMQQLKPHFHYQYEFLLVTGGTANFVIDKKMYHITPGSILFMSNTENHCIVQSTRGYSRYLLRFSTEVLSSYLRDPVLVSIFKQRPENFNHHYSCTQEEFAHFCHLAERMAQEYEQRQEYWDQMIIGYLLHILVAIYRRKPDMFPVFPAAETQQLIFQVQNYIEAHVNEDLSLDKLSAMFYVNKYYLSHSFTKATGYSLKKFIITVRIAKGKHLLLHTKKDIKTISEEVGFNSVSHFIRTFKAYEQLSPLQYRNHAEKSDR